MSRTIQLEKHTVGFCMANGMDGEEIPVQQSGFFTSADGELFLRLLEGVSSGYAPAFGHDGVPPSQVDHFLAVVRPDRTATLYCNELRLTSRVRINRVGHDGMNVGEPVFGDDVADFESLELHDATGNLIDIPDDHGFSLILSYRWRKGLLFDYSVFGPEPRRRTDHLPTTFAHALARLMFPELYAVTDTQWATLFKWGRFPFVGLPHDHRRQLLNWATEGRYPATLLDGFCRDYMGKVETRLKGWRQNELLEPHTGFLTTALERYRAGDHVSCISVLYPRVEGVMRSLFVEENPGQRADQEEMVVNLVENQYPHSMLLPQRFRAYLSAVYFQGFDVSKGNLPLSRHTVAHGVSKAGDYDFVRAAVGFMIFDQLFHYLSD